MNREQAENLIAAYVFDELDEPVRSELVAYLQTDAELAERVGDMRLTAKLLREGIEAQGPPALSDHRRARLTQRVSQKPWRHRVLTVGGAGVTRRVAALAACLALCAALVALFLPSLGSARRTSRQLQTATQMRGIAQSMEMFAQENDGRYPEHLAELVDRGYITPEYLVAPHSTAAAPRDWDRLSEAERRDWVDHHSGFTLTAPGGAGGTLDSEQIVGYAQAPDGKGAWVARADGSVGFEQDTAIAADRAGSMSGGFTYESTPSATPGSAQPQRMIDVNADSLRVAEARRAAVSKLAESQASFGRVEGQLATATDQPANGPTDDYWLADGSGQAGDTGSAFFGLRQGQAGSSQTAHDYFQAPPPTNPSGEAGARSTTSLGIDFAAQAMKQTMEDSQAIVEHRRIDRLKSLESAQLSSASENNDAAIPYDDLLTYPADWPQITETRLADLTEDGTKDKKVETRVYDIRDLTTEVPDFATGPSFDLNATGPSFDLNAALTSFDLNAALSNQSSGGDGGGGSGGVFGPRSANEIAERGPVPLPEPAPEPRATARWSNEPGQTAAAQPLPPRQAAVLDQLKAARTEIMVADPTQLLRAAERYREAGDLYAAKDMLDQAAGYLPDDLRPRRSGGEEGEALEQMQELSRDVNHAERAELALSEDATRRLAQDVAVLGKRLELARRAQPQQAQQLAQMAQQVEAMEAEDSERPDEAVLRPGDALALSVFDATDLDKEQAWQAVVDEQGWIAVPGKGRLNVKGLTPSQVESAVAEREKRQIKFVSDLEPEEPPKHAAVILLTDGDERTEKLREESEQLKKLEPVEVEAALARKPRLMPVNPWVMTERDRLSTFALDVDTASYAIARRHIADGYLPPRHTVRMEEFVNAFDYQYPAGRDREEAFAVHAEAGPAPFASDPNTVLLKVGVRGKVVGRDQAKPAHLVFVIDTSGSMERDDRLPLVKRSIAMLLEQLAEADRVSVVTYGNRSSLLIANAPASAKAEILDTLERLQSGGSTNLGAGVNLGFQVAQRHFLTGGVNRVVLCSDGVANVGPDQAQTLADQVARLRGHGVTFTSIGVGTDTAGAGYDDAILEDLANKGDGTYHFIGSDDDARRVFVEGLAATRPTIAFDAKIQVDFDPQRVRRYRLIGYENRDIADADFRNDAVDAGEVGSGQSATALYELELHGPALARHDAADLGTVFIRYRDADTQQVRETQTRLGSALIRKRSPSEDPRFFLAAAAAHVAEALRGSDHVRDRDTDRNLQQAQRVLEEVSIALPLDARVRELLDMTRRAQGLPRAP